MKYTPIKDRVDVIVNKIKFNNSYDGQSSILDGKIYELSEILSGQYVKGNGKRMVRWTEREAAAKAKIDEMHGYLKKAYECGQITEDEAVTFGKGMHDKINTLVKTTMTKNRYFQRKYLDTRVGLDVYNSVNSIESSLDDYRACAEQVREELKEANRLAEPGWANADRAVMSAYETSQHVEEPNSLDITAPASIIACGKNIETEFSKFDDKILNWQKAQDVLMLQKLRKNRLFEAPRKTVKPTTWYKKIPRAALWMFGF